MYEPESGGTEWDYTGPLNESEAEYEAATGPIEDLARQIERKQGVSRPAAQAAADAALREQAIEAHAEARRTMAVHNDGHWEPMDVEAAEALHASGDRPMANRIQIWTLDQGDVWVNLYGVRNQLAQMDEAYLLNVIAFLYRTPVRLSRLWLNDQVIQNQINPKFRLDLERMRLAKEDPHRWLTQSKLMTCLWAEVFKRRGRIGNGSEHVED